MSSALLLDEMHSPVVGATLRERGYDVVGVVDQDELRALTDEQLFRWAAEHDRRIVTENVKDFARSRARLTSRVISPHVCCSPVVALSGVRVVTLGRSSTHLMPGCAPLM